MWDDRSWAVYFLTFKAFFISILMPAFAVAVTNNSAMNRMFALLAAMSSWFLSLITRNLETGLKRGNHFIVVTNWLTGDWFMLITLIASFYVLAMNSSGSFDAFSSNLKVPYSHRWWIFVVVVCYWVCTGLCEMAFVLSTSVMSATNLEDTDMVWPPDYADCSKPISIVYTLCKPLLAIYCIFILLCNRNIDEQHTKQVERVRARIAIGAACCWSAEIVIAILEQQYGVKYGSMLAFNDVLTDGAPIYYDIGQDPCGFLHWDGNSTIPPLPQDRRQTKDPLDMMVYCAAEVQNQTVLSKFWIPQSVVKLEFESCLGLERSTPPATLPASALATDPGTGSGPGTAPGSPPATTPGSPPATAPGSPPGRGPGSGPGSQGNPVTLCILEKASQVNQTDLPNLLCINTSWHIAECTSNPSSHMDCCNLSV